MEFFRTQAIQDALIKSNVRLAQISGDRKVDLLRIALTIIHDNAASFDEMCAVTLQRYSAGAGTALVTLAQAGPDSGLIDKVFAYIYQFVLEYDLSVEVRLHDHLLEFLTYGREQLSRFNADAQHVMRSAAEGLPIAILKALLGSDSVRNLKGHEAIKDSIDARIAEWENRVVAQSKEAVRLEESLKEYKDGFNFVGLYEGFDDLATKKAAERTVRQRLVAALGCLTLVPAVVEVLFIWMHVTTIEKDMPLMIVSSLPALSMTLIVLYFFRLMVRSLESVNSQILQIELRKTLCRFIQSYVEYAKGAKAADKESLSKFESIIFSGIVGTDEKIPATFDGIEQIAGLIKAVKPGGQ